MSRNLWAVRRVLWTTLALNLVVASAKLIYGLNAGLLAMAADGVHSFLDGGSNLVGLVGVSAARRPPDRDHPYGHRKFETFAALTIGGMLFLASWEILKAAWGRLGEPPVAEVGGLGYVVMVLTMAVNLGVSVYEKREGQRLKSEVLLADSVHTRSDLLTSATVLCALIAAQLGWGVLDPIVTFVIVAWIGYSAFGVMRPALATLADEARLDPSKLDAMVMAVPGVRDVHRIRTRGSMDEVFVDLHLQVDPSLSISEAHQVAHAVESAIRHEHAEVVDVLVHVEPHGDPVEGLDGSIVGPPR
jgi:cation diffusion facilitator family transporter